ncbi:hypothetical protein BD779DRAFT_349413 [Infundibulicybe gibba]|nr:hypothetical protein BD779DRAFT_349413 [Infundibulicybe gibba]
MDYYNLPEGATRGIQTLHQSRFKIDHDSSLEVANKRSNRAVATNAMENQLVIVPTEALGSPPVRRAVFDLPVEVLGEIFLHCLPPGKWGSLSERDAPWLLIKVCRSWREVALSTPLLWSRLPFISGEISWKKDCLRLLELYLENSMGTALSLGFELAAPDSDDAPFLSVVAPHLFRSQHLSIKHPRSCSRS